MPETASWFAAPVLVGVEGDAAAAPGCPAALDGDELDEALDDSLDDALCDADAIGSISIATSSSTKATPACQSSYTGLKELKMKYDAHLFNDRSTRSGRRAGITRNRLMALA